MAFNSVPTVANGDSWSAAQHNTYLRDNMAALWPYSVAGDIAYATGANALTRLGIGTIGYLLRVNAAGTGLEWAAGPKVLGGQAQRNAAQSIPNGAYTAVSFDGEIFDSGSVWTAGANQSKLFAPVTGKYLITGFVGWLANATNLRECYIAINAGSPIVYDSRVAVSGAARRSGGVALSRRSQSRPRPAPPRADRRSENP